MDGGTVIRSNSDRTGPATIAPASDLINPRSLENYHTDFMEIPAKLKEYIDNNRGSLPPITDPDEPLRIDSLGLIRLVAFLESDFGYRIEDEELVAENFATLRTLGELLATKTPTAPAAEVKAPTEEAIPTFSARREAAK